MKKLAFFILASIMSSCMSMEMVRSSNRSNLNILSIGMSKQEVLTTMGTKTIQPSNSTTLVNNPWRTETQKTKSGEMCEILFYYTDLKKEDGGITDDELTPIVLQDNKVVGWGWMFLNENVAYEIRMR